MSNDRKNTGYYRLYEQKLIGIVSEIGQNDGAAAAS